MSETKPSDEFSEAIEADDVSTFASTDTSSGKNITKETLYKISEKASLGIFKYLLITHPQILRENIDIILNNAISILCNTSPEEEKATKAFEIIELVCKTYSETDLKPIINDNNYDDTTILQKAVMAGYPDFVDYLMNTYGANPNIITNNFHYPPLALAIMSGNLEIIPTLIRSKADISFLLEYNRFEQFLLANGISDKEVKNNIGAVMQFIENDLDMIKTHIINCFYPRYLKKPENPSPENLMGPFLFDFMRRNNIICLRFLLKNFGLNFDLIKDSFGQTLLHEACEHNNFPMVQYFMEHSADVNARDKYNKIPLPLACKHNNFPMVQCLVEHGADVNARDDYNRTPLFYACFNNNLSIARYLVKNGADVNAENKYNRAPLIWACKHNNFLMVQYLIEHGAGVNVIDEDKKAPLLWACWNCTSQLFR